MCQKSLSSRSMPSGHSEKTADLSGLLCPLPVLRARKLLDEMERGDVLRITATDPMAAVDVPHFCREQGHELLLSEQKDGKLIFRIRRR